MSKKTTKCEHLESIFIVLKSALQLVQSLKTFWIHNQSYSRSWTDLWK